MIKPDMPNIPNMANMPGMSAMTDTLDFVKNLWGGMAIPGMNMAGMKMPGMNVPGMVMPTLSVEEINKKISDLKAVESWLVLNMNMLRGTIQALEVQSATLSTLQTMGDNFAASMTPPSREAAPARPAAHATNGSAKSESPEKLHGAPEPTSKDESDAAHLTAPLVNAAAWWNLLQDQFQQAVSSAMAPERQTGTVADKPKPKARKSGAASSSGSAPRKRKTT